MIWYSLLYIKDGIVFGIIKNGRNRGGIKSKTRESHNLYSLPFVFGVTQNAQLYYFSRIPSILMEK